MNSIMQLKETVELLTGVRRGADPALFLSDATKAGILKADGSPVTSEGNDWQTVFRGPVDRVVEFKQAGLVGFDRLYVEWYIQPDVTADFFEFRGSTNGGQSYSAAANWSQALIYSITGSTTVGLSQPAGGPYLKMSHDNTIPALPTLDYAMSGRFFMHNWNKAIHKLWSNDGNWYQATSGQVLSGRDGGYNNSREVWDSLQIKLHNGGTFSGRIHVMGLPG